MARTLNLGFMRVTIYLLIGGTIVSSCLPEPLDVKGIPVVKPQIVVSTQIIPDQSVVVLLTKTFGALDASNDSDPEELLKQIAIDDAVVTIAGPRGTYELEPLENGLYGGLIIPFEVGEEYELRVNSESLGQVSAVTTVKPLVSFDDIKAELVFNGFDDTLAQITYQLSDPIGQNWYMLNVQQIERDEVLDDLLNPRAFTRLMEDQNFNGPVHKETFRDSQGILSRAIPLQFYFQISARIIMILLISGWITDSVLLNISASQLITLQMLKEVKDFLTCISRM